jgi:hypothetical protein
MEVRKIQGNKGSYRWEPPLDPRWPALKRLKWKAAIVAQESGLEIAIGARRQNPGKYTVIVTASSNFQANAGGNYDGCWSILDGIEMGVKAVRANDAPQIVTTPATPNAQGEWILARDAGDVVPELKRYKVPSQSLAMWLSNLASKGLVVRKALTRAESEHFRTLNQFSAPRFWYSVESLRQYVKRREQE